MKINVSKYIIGRGCNRRERENEKKIVERDAAI
jgi:hypothetical protein